MSVTLVRYDAAKKALAAASRVDEAKNIRDRAEAVRVYATQARDYDLQNRAATIRLLAERRAGQLLIDMEKNPGTRGIGRTAKNGTSRARYPRATAVPPTLEELNISKVQSSKWQRLARLIDDDSFEEALRRAKEFGELTTAGVLRMVKEVLRPADTVVKPNPSTLAEALLRDIESASRTVNLKEAVRNREHLNITLRSKLILAVKHAAKEYTKYGEQLSDGFTGFENTGKAYQRVVRENAEKIPDPDIDEKRRLAADLKSATVREISYEEAKSVIVANEWLASMGTTEFSFGLFFGNHLGAVVCLGSTGGSNVASSVCGVEHKHKVAVICRGASLSWAHPHSGSFIVSAACREMTKKGYNIFVAYSDPDAGEIGTIYSSCNFLYCSMTNPIEQFRTPDGKVHDSRQVSGLARDRSGGTLKYKRSRAEQKKLLLEQGCEFFEGTAKHRYVGIYGDRRTKRTLKAALRWPVLPYPKRPTVEEPIQVESA